MASQRQIDANRRNSRLSTGPVTPEGKAEVARNSLTHGFRSQDAVLPYENRQDFLDLLADLQAEHAPVGVLERFFVHQMASAQWRLQRIVRIETGLITARVAVAIELERDDDEDEDDEDEDDEDDENPEDPPAPPPLSPEEEHAEQTRLLGKTFADNSAGDPFAKLFRYENLLRRSFYKALDNLRIAQARRRAAAPSSWESKMTEQSQSQKRTPGPAPHPMSQ
jgi:hypothetical protein